MWTVTRGKADNVVGPQRTIISDASQPGQVVVMSLEPENWRGSNESLRGNIPLRFVDQ